MIYGAIRIHVAIEAAAAVAEPLDVELEQYRQAGLRHRDRRRASFRDDLRLCS
jgi:hypothetical protein